MEQQNGHQGYVRRFSFQDTDMRNETPVSLAIIQNKFNMAKIMITAAKTLKELHGDDEYEEDDDENKDGNEDALDGEVADADKADGEEDNNDEEETEGADDDDDDDDDEDEEDVYRRTYPNLHLACMHGRLDIVNIIFEAEKKLGTTDKSKVYMYNHCRP
jgi:polygalacturonase